MSQTGTEKDLVRQNTQPGEQASVWNTENPHDGHTDATLYQHEQSGRVTKADKAHVEE